MSERTRQNVHRIEKERRDFDGAMADFNKALELNPKDVLASYQRGVMRFERGDNDGAISDFDKAIELAAK
ncbi:MAG TPA: tetratricopeptide repeat protein, partial [Blastocatellia bacterium]|nr:tetratricopeptide repeat protein [Blastocatellia bacterium]